MRHIYVVWCPHQETVEEALTDRGCFATYEAAEEMAHEFAFETATKIIPVEINE